MSKLHLETSKINKQLELTAEAGLGEAPPVVFVLSGALSPVHKMHIECFEVLTPNQLCQPFKIAKREMQKRGHRVVGAFLCPSSEAYVNNKVIDCSDELLNFAATRRCHLS